MANNFKPWVDSPTTTGQQVQSASAFADDTQRINGFKAGDPASALRVNSALRQANIVVAGLMQMCDDIKTLPDGLSLMSTVTQIKNAIKAAIDQLDATVLASAKSYTDTREGVIDGKITNVQNQVTSNKNELDALEPRVDNLEDEVAALSDGSSTLGTRVSTLESEMDTAQADITQLKGGGSSSSGGVVIENGTEFQLLDYNESFQIPVQKCYKVEIVIDNTRASERISGLKVTSPNMSAVTINWQNSQPIVVVTLYFYSDTGHDGYVSNGYNTEMIYSTSSFTLTPQYDNNGTSVEATVYWRVYK